MATLGNAANFSWAIFSICGWLIPHLSMEMGEYHRALAKSPLWSSDELRETGWRAICNATVLGNAIAFAFIVGGACAVALTTQNLEPRMVDIVIGLSRLVGATFLFGLSWNFPEWLEVYHIRSRRDVLPVTRSVRALKFNVVWSVLARHLQVYFFFLPFFCGAGIGLIAIAMVTGIALGLAIDVCVYIGKEKLKTGRKKMWLIFGMISVAVICSGLLFASGCANIAYVWRAKDRTFLAAVVCGTLFAWIAVAAVIHVVLWQLTKENVQEMLQGTGATSVRQLANSYRYKNRIGEVIVTEAPKAIRETVGKTKAAASTVTGSGNKRVASSETEMGPPPQEEEGGEETPASKTVAFAAKDEEVGGDLEEAQEQAQDPPAESAQGEGEGGDIFAEEAEAAYDEGEVEDPTLCELCKTKCCCFGGTARCWGSKETPREKATSCTKWILWSLLVVASLFFVVINSGATYQQDVTRDRLPDVFQALYLHLNDGEVCAYDGDGTEGSLNENSIITTFESKEAAHEAGYLVVHCGKCGHCSTYPNIKYQYTTAGYLAEASRRCGMTSFLSGGGRGALHKCLMDEPINFDYECGICWVETTQCAKSHCAFIGIQSMLINTMMNLDVGPNDITAASCNEANCEAWEYPNNFAECSGASRRKMAIENRIKRPADQTCQIVDVDWAVLFPEAKQDC